MLVPIQAQMLEGMTKAELGKVVPLGSSSAAAAPSGTEAKPFTTFADSMIAITELHTVQVASHNADAEKTTPVTETATPASQVRPGFRRAIASEVVEQAGDTASSCGVQEVSSQAGNAFKPMTGNSQTAIELVPLADTASDLAPVVGTNQGKVAALPSAQTGTTAKPLSTTSGDIATNHGNALRLAINTVSIAEPAALPRQIATNRSTPSQDLAPSAGPQKKVAGTPVGTSVGKAAKFVPSGDNANDSGTPPQIASLVTDPPFATQAAIPALKSHSIPKDSPAPFRASIRASEAPVLAAANVEGKGRDYGQFSGQDNSQFSGTPKFRLRETKSEIASDPLSAAAPAVGSSQDASVATAAPVPPQTAQPTFVLKDSPPTIIGTQSSVKLAIAGQSPSIPFQIVASDDSVAAKPLPQHIVQLKLTNDLAFADVASSGNATTSPAGPTHATPNPKSTKAIATSSAAPSALGSAAGQESFVAVNTNTSKRQTVAAPGMETNSFPAVRPVEQETPVAFVPASAAAPATQDDGQVTNHHVLITDAVQIPTHAPTASVATFNATAIPSVKATNESADDKASTVAASADPSGKPVSATLSAAVPDQATPHAPSVTSAAPISAGSPGTVSSLAASVSHAATHSAMTQNGPSSAVTGSERSLGANGNALLAAEPTSDIQPHRTLQSTATTLEVGVPNGTEGWLRVRAEVGSSGEIIASLSAATSTGQDLLHRQLPALNTFLHEERVAVTTTVSDRTFSNAGGGNGNAASDGAMQQNTGHSDHRASSSAYGIDSITGVTRSVAFDDFGPANEFAAAQPSLSLESGRWLNVQA